MKLIKPRIATANLGVAQPPAKRADPYYYTREWRQTRSRVLQRDGYLCTKCRHRLATIVDHIASRTAGGSDDDDNLRSLCAACDNQAKENHLGVRRGPARPR